MANNAFDKWFNLKFWGTVLKITSRIQPSSKYYTYKYYELLSMGKDNEAKRLLIRASNYYHKNYLFKNELAKIYYKSGEMSASLKQLNSLNKQGKLKDEDDYLLYLKLLCKTGNKKKHKIISEIAIREVTDKARILEYLFHYSIKLNDFKLAKEYYDQIDNEKKVQKDTLIKRAMLYQFEGNVDSANEMYARLFNDVNEQDKYTKIILYDNGKSRVEFYKRHQNVSMAMFLFDSINITWEDSPFGYKFLSRQPLDIIALRRKRADSYHQDFLVDEYHNVVSSLSKLYSRKLAYGFSLGGYTSLYYGSSINAEILSISPRNSTHPIYGLNQQTKELYKHEVFHKVNNEISPIIFYDPKNRTDKFYVEKELKTIYPYATLVEFSYVGHRIAPFLSQINVLKDIVENFIDGNKQLISEMKYEKRESYQYLRVLSEVCYSRGKLSWAKGISELALRKNPNDRRAFKVKVSTLICEGEYEEALFEITQFNNVDRWLEYLELLLKIKENNIAQDKMVTNLIYKLINKKVLN